MSVKPHPDGYPIKLVRDKTQAIINPSGEPGDLFYGLIPADQNRIPWLKKKLGEEVFEFIVDGGVSELAQAVGVIDALALEYDSSIDDLIKMFNADPRGRFDNAVMMYGKHKEYDK